MPVSPKPASRTRMVVVAVVTALLGASGSAAYAALDDESGNAPGASASARTVGRPYVKTELLFGTAKPTGGPPVTDQEFHAFVDEFVTPRFPAGLTVEDTHGQYRDAHGIIEHERSYQLTLLYPKDEASADSRKIQEIRTTYNARFAQESVARIDDNEFVDF